MRRIIILPLMLALGVVSGDMCLAAGRAAPRGASNTTSNGVATKSSANGARAAKMPGGAAKTTAGVKTTSNTKSPNGARAAKMPGGAAKTVGVKTTSNTKSPNGARAAATQKVINVGTKVSTATANTVISQECQDAYFGCMDAFCMLDNTSGGRCQCSDKNVTLNSVLDEIIKLDEQSYQLATVGVERIKMGEAADEIIAKAEAAENKVISGKSSTDTKTVEGKKVVRKSLDLTAWNNSIYSETDSEDEIFKDASLEETPDDFSNKTGDELHTAAAKLCVAQVPDSCKSSGSMLQLIYSQKIKSDCTAYENSLKQQKNSSAQKLHAAQQALRDAALEEYQNANKFDLGECTIKFKQCMQTTAECGEDFTGCVTLAAAENVKNNKSGSKAKQTTIKGSVSSITLAAATIDQMLSKKPLCESVTKQCVAVKDQVWDTFLREVAPVLKTAELNAESNLRTNCLSNISSCFQKACKDNIDPNDPDGSFDMCISKPDNYKSFCKIQLEPCLEATGGTYDNPKKSTLWQSVLARLAVMRVDACTTAVKSCLQSDDRCGEDYSQCVGLDTDTIVQMCPDDKLMVCQTEYGDADALDEYLSRTVQGIFLSIDNNMLTTCQKAADEAMVKVCGDTESCNGMTVDDGIGTRSLEYRICEYKNNVNTGNCVTNLDAIQDADLGRNSRAADGETVTHEVKTFIPVIQGKIDWSLVTVDKPLNEEEKESIDYQVISANEYMSLAQTNGFYSGNNQEEIDKVTAEIGTLQSSVNNALAAINADATVTYCRTGRKVQGMKVDGKEVSLEGTGRFTGLMDQKSLIIADSTISAAKQNYIKKYDELLEKAAKDNIELGQRMAKIRGENEADAKRESGRQSCMAQVGKGFDDPAVTNKNNMTASWADSDYSYKKTVTVSYKMDTMVCHKCTRTQNCDKVKGTRKNRYCKYWGDEQEACADIQY